MELLDQPKHVLVGSGRGEGNYPLLAFDLGLQDAGVGNLNLMRVTSVFPPRAELHFIEYNDPHLPEPGALTPCVYSRHDGSHGDLIGCAIAVGIPDDPQFNGLIFETSGFGPGDQFAKDATSMVEQAMIAHHIPLREILTVQAELRISQDYGSVVCVAVLTD